MKRTCSALRIRQAPASVNLPQCIRVFWLYGFGILGKSPESLMCHFSRCIQKIDGALRYYPCPVIYDDARFELGRTLEESFTRVYVAHKNCYDYCIKGGGAS